MTASDTATATATEHALHFACRGEGLVGVLHLPPQALARAVLVITGGPQYRAGSHRQFVLLGRQLAAAGIAVMRFDYRGMGDSDGAPRGFDDVGDDLRAATDHFFAVVPQLRELVLWGLCDGATAAAFYAAEDRRITGLVLLNPWVRTEAGWAQASLRHYYLRRLCSGAFWRKLVGGTVDAANAVASLRRVALSALQGKPRPGVGDLPAQLHRALVRFPGRMLIILAGADLGAREFCALPAQHRHWRQLLGEARVHRVEIAHANHTFARRAWRERVAMDTLEWLASW